MKPITYFVQNTQINELVAEFGERLQDMEPCDFNGLTVCLAWKRLMGEDTFYSPGDALEIFDPEYNHTTNQLVDICECVNKMSYESMMLLLTAMTP